MAQFWAGQASAGKHICNFMSFGKIWTNATFVYQLHSNSARSHPSQTFHSFNQLEGIFFAANWYLAEALSYLALEPTLPGFSGPSAPNVQAAAWKFIPHSSYVHLSSSLLLPCSHTHTCCHWSSSWSSSRRRAPSVKIHFADGSHVTGCPTDRTIQPTPRFICFTLGLV